MPALRTLLDLTTAEAHALASEATPEGRELPPLEACENEDWGRDLLLQALFKLSEAELAAHGLRRE